MTEIDLHTGKFSLNGQFFQKNTKKDTNDSYSVGKNLYSNISLDGEIKNIPFRAIGYYKNETLKSISLTIDSERVKKNYLLQNDTDIGYNLTHYVDFWKGLTENLLNEIICSKKRNFDWGKIQVLIDPREPLVYVEIKYY